MGNSESSKSNDLFDLSHFIEAQDQHGTYSRALTELRQGRKQTHWMWYIFPQIDGLGSSDTARRYAIRSLDEARSYLKHPILGERLQECSEVVLSIEGKSANQMLGSPDDMKLKSSMTLFAHIAEENSVFVKVLEKYYQGKPDLRTLQLI